MENYLHLVRYNAERIHVKLPDEVELDDLMSAGIFGLMDAINAFDLERGVKFETYCAPRIRGAILDELRSMDWVPRLVRSRAHKLDGASKQLEVELGRAPTNEEVAKRLKVPDGRVREDGQGRQRRRPGLAVAASGSKPTATRTSARSTSWKTSAAPTPCAKSSARISRN
jgi:DNA-directed RNA polymerase specialized sigma subunit